MKASEFIGKIVIDKKALEVGRIADMIIKAKKCLIDKIIISKGPAINRKYFSINENEIAEIGDFILLNLDKEETDERVGTVKLDDIEKTEITFGKFTGKTVIAQKGLEVGKVVDMVIEPKGCLINNVIISTGPAIRKKYFMVGEGEISEIGDYVLLNLDKETINKRIENESDEEKPKKVLKTE
jgi:sporulation protein YlmC with PRC-barrel domain